MAPADKHTPDIRLLPFAYFRPAGDDEIETTLGARFPAAHGKRAYRTLLPVRKAGGTYAANGHTIHVGAFQVDSMNEAGVIQAGCHIFEWSEVERLAAALGWGDGHMTLTERVKAREADAA